MRKCANCGKEFKARVGLGLCRGCWNDNAIRCLYEPLAPFGGAEARQLRITPMRSETVPLSRIKIDGGTQTRAAVKQEAVDEYAAALEAGETLPEVVVFEDGAGHLWMADGFHRYLAHRQAKKPKILAKIKNGTRRDALLHSAGCNATHGLRRSTEDKRHAVKLLLADPEWDKSSDRWIAEKCHVSHTFVAGVRDSQVATLPQENSRAESEQNSSVGENINTGLEDDVYRGPPVFQSTVTGLDGKTYPAFQVPRTETPHEPEADAPLEVQAEAPVEMEREPGVEPPEEDEPDAAPTPVAEKPPPSNTNGKFALPMEKEIDAHLKRLESFLIASRDQCESSDQHKPAYLALRKSLSLLSEDWAALKRGRVPQLVRAVISREGIEGLAREVKAMLRCQEEFAAHPSAQAKMNKNNYERRVDGLCREILSPKSKGLFDGANA